MFLPVQLAKGLEAPFGGVDFATIPQVLPLCAQLRSQAAAHPGLSPGATQL